ncbi:DUF1360 domain-containing protein [Texcoconibacillus texcoconensis]|uniref:DUF1360 domain-containing protein n=1 Tax=Texcoconibacillus texcoconensis TaxID=1095777 RepID=A0A840QU93_9BACI|nr:DUF1360 domain-containing protein [Texcoconibacillus texcoconensis]MBB5174859.1 hypothetical protein [Texcoconibacillus texcoconensis]
MSDSIYIEGWPFMILVLATFRLTHLLVYDKITEWLRDPFQEMKEEQLEDGTFVSYPEPKGTGLRRWIGELLSCHWCTGVWVSVAVYSAYHLFPHIAFPVWTVFAIAGVAAIVQTIILYFEQRM